MDYEGMETVVCDAEENDWLSVSYHENKYADKSRKPRIKMPRLKINKKVTAAIAVAVLCVALLATMLFVDGGFSKDVFGAVKTAYSSLVFAPSQAQKPLTAKIKLPCNVNLVEVSEDGVAKFDGGRAVTSFTDGKVVSVGEDSVTVAIDENTSIMYQGLSEVYVAREATVAANALLGKYEGDFTAVISVSGEVVKQVVGSQSQLEWNV